MSLCSHVLPLKEDLLKSNIIFPAAILVSVRSYFFVLIAITIQKYGHCNGNLAAKFFGLKFFKLNKSS